HRVWGNRPGIRCEEAPLMTGMDRKPPQQPATGPPHGSGCREKPRVTAYSDAFPLLAPVTHNEPIRLRGLFGSNMQLALVGAGDAALTVAAQLVRGWAAGQVNGAELGSGQWWP